MVIATFDVQTIPNDGRSGPSFSSVLYELDEDVTRHRGSAPTRKHDNVQSTSYVQNATDYIRKQGGVPQQLYESNKMYGTQPNRIAFGSCNEQDMTNKLWNIISERKPTAFIWGGDAVYAGTKESYDFSSQLISSSTRWAFPVMFMSLNVILSVQILYQIHMVPLTGRLYHLSQVTRVGHQNDCINYINNN